MEKKMTWAEIKKQYFPNLHEHDWVGTFGSAYKTCKCGAEMYEPLVAPI